MLKNKIFLVSFEYVPVTQGGLARHAAEIINRLLKLNRVFTAVVAVPKNKKINIDKKIIKIPCYFFYNKYLCYLEFSAKLYLKFYREFDNKFVFFSSFSYLFNVFLPKKFYLFITNTTKRVFLTDYPDETLFERFIRKLTYFFLFNWENYMSKKAIKIFAISDSTKEDTVNQYKINGDKIKIVSCALNKIIFIPAKQKNVFNKNLLFVGRLVPRKNIIDLVKITKLLVSTDNNFILNLVGGGEYKYVEKIKKEISKNNLQKNVIFYGKVTDDKLNKLYKSNCIFVFTSLVEGFGLVLLEAMSKGLPVVAYDIVGVRDVVISRENGFLIKSGNIYEFAEKILFLNKDFKIYQKFSRKAIKRICDFSWNRSVITLNKILTNNL